MKKHALTLVIMCFFISSYSAANEVRDELMKIAKNSIEKWVEDPVLIEMIKAQNKKHASLTMENILKLDKTWRAQTKSSNSPFIDTILSSDASEFLKIVKEQSEGLFTEIFVMDNRGMNVAQSDITSDYWQGDEPKWQKTFSNGIGSVHIGKIKIDESTQQLQAQVSVTIVDPKTKQVIGAVTVGINVDNL